MRERKWVRPGAVVVLVAAVSVAAVSTSNDQVSGLITRTYVLVEDTELIGNVTCDVTGAPCFAFGAPGVELRLNGFSITGKADPVTGCGGAVTGSEFGISTAGMARASVQGPGLVQRFRNHGVAVIASTGARIQGITASTNCAAGVFVAATSFDALIERNVAVRNGSTAAGFACGGV
jgi:hypothetical protein